MLFTLFMLDYIKAMEHCNDDTVLVLGDEVEVETSTMVRCIV